RSVLWAAPSTDVSPTVRANDYGGIFNEYNEYNHEPAMLRPQQNLSWLATSDDSVAAIPKTLRHASHVLGPQDTHDRSDMSLFANDDERRAFLSQFPAAAPSTTATERPTSWWLVGTSSASMDAKMNPFWATYATSSTSLSGSMPRAPWLDLSSLSLSLDQSVTKDTSLYRGLLSDDATAFRSAFIDPPRPPPSTYEYYRARTPPPPLSAARPPMPPSPPRTDSRAAAANRTDATATLLLQDRERHLTKVHVTWLHDRLRAEYVRRAAADAEVASLRARVMEHHVRRGGTSRGEFGGNGAWYATSARTTEPRANDEWNRGNGTSRNDPDATWRASLMRMGMPRSPTAAPSYRSDSTILAKSRYDNAQYAAGWGSAVTRRSRRRRHGRCGTKSTGRI
ncbi:hypothetical protein GGF32_004941, partial [Allomyces javanicus]